MRLPAVIALRFAALLVLPAVAFAQLGPAPRFDASAVSLPHVGAKDLIAGSPINTQHRGEVVGHFFSRWWPYLNVPVAWTGSVPSCTVGAIGQSSRESTINSINYYRAMARLPDTVALDAAFNTSGQRMALMIGANADIDHFPPPSWACYSADGANAAGRSNLAYGVSGADAIDLYIDDPGAGNSDVGHRRWILFPPQVRMGTGDVESGGGGAMVAGNALRVIDGWGTRPASPEWVAWPPPGFVPYWVLPDQSNRWSFSYPSANFANATVSMTRGSTPITVSAYVADSGYGDNTLVWLPQGVSYAAPAADTTYNIVIGNVIVAGQARSFSYAVTVINPRKPAKLADLDNDGVSEIVWFNPFTQQGALWFMRAGQFHHSSFVGVPSGWVLQGSADVNGDGNGDLIWTHAGANQLAVWFMNAGAMTASQVFSMGAGWTLRAIGDLNGDGRADFMFRNQNGAIAAWLMNAAGIASTIAYPASGGSDWLLVGAVDLLGAGKQQALWRHLPSGGLFLWTNADTASPGMVGLGNPGGSWQLAALGDFDGDGVDDLFWRDAVGTNAIWLAGNAANAVFPPGVGTDWSPVATGKYYGDGRSNVLWRHQDGTIAQWRFNAALVPSVTFLPTAPSGWAPASM